MKKFLFLLIAFFALNASSASPDEFIKITLCDGEIEFYMHHGFYENLEDLAQDILEMEEQQCP